MCCTIPLQTDEMRTDFEYNPRCARSPCLAARPATAPQARSGTDHCVARRPRPEAPKRPKPEATGYMERLSPSDTSNAAGRFRELAGARFGRTGPPETSSSGFVARRTKVWNLGCVNRDPIRAAGTRSFFTQRPRTKYSRAPFSPRGSRRGSGICTAVRDRGSCTP